MVLLGVGVLIVRPPAEAAALHYVNPEVGHGELGRLFALEGRMARVLQGFSE